MTRRLQHLTDEPRAKPLQSHQGDGETADGSRASVELRVVRVAPVLRALQREFSQDRDLISLEVDESVHVAADEALLARAVSSLLNAAIRLSADGARVFLRCRAEEPGVAIEVQDDGTGLASAKLRDVFKVVSADRVEQLGRALGLARHAVEKMGGDLFVESHPELGRRFALLFPNTLRVA